MPKDACYYRVKAQYETFPSARASQAIAKCRKKSGHVRRGKAGRSLQKWKNQHWRDTISGKPCGGSKNKREYCRPAGAHPHNLKANQNRKRHGLRAKRAT